MHEPQRSHIRQSNTPWSLLSTTAPASRPPPVEAVSRRPFAVDAIPVPKSIHPRAGAKKGCGGGPLVHAGRFSCMPNLEPFLESSLETLSLGGRGLGRNQFHAPCTQFHQPPATSSLLSFFTADASPESLASCAACMRLREHVQGLCSRVDERPRQLPDLEVRRLALEIVPRPARQSGRNMQGIVFANINPIQVSARDRQVLGYGGVAISTH